MTNKSYTCWASDPEDTWKSDAWCHEAAAEDYVEYCEKNRDGWEWLDRAEIFISDGTTTRKFDVACQMVPEYSVNEDDEWEPETIPETV